MTVPEETESRTEIRSHVTHIFDAVWGIVRALSELAHGPHDRKNLSQVLHKVRRHLNGCQVMVGRLIDALRKQDSASGREPKA